MRNVELQRGLSEACSEAWLAFPAELESKAFGWNPETLTKQQSRHASTDDMSRPVSVKAKSVGAMTLR
jgi:hypothetical protein